MPVGLVQFADPVCSGSYQKQSPQAKAMRAECVGVSMRLITQSDLVAQHHLGDQA